MIRKEELNLVTEWDKTFPKSEKVEHSKRETHNADHPTEDWKK